jgi:hypothetical protein
MPTAYIIFYLSFALNCNKSVKNVSRKIFYFYTIRDFRLGFQLDFFRWPNVRTRPCDALWVVHWYFLQMNTSAVDIRGVFLAYFTCVMHFSLAVGCFDFRRRNIKAEAVSPTALDLTSHFWASRAPEVVLSSISVTRRPNHLLLVL